MSSAQLLGLIFLIFYAYVPTIFVFICEGLYRLKLTQINILALCIANCIMYKFGFTFLPTLIVNIVFYLLYVCMTCSY